MVRSRRRSVQSALTRPPVDAHERMRDYLTEAEFLLLLQGTRANSANTSLTSVRS